MRMMIEGILKRFPKIAARFSPQTIMQFLRYLIVGFSSFAIEYSLFIIIRGILPTPELFVNVAVYTTVFWFNFLLNRIFAFKSKRNILKQVLMYSLLFTFNLIVGNIILFSAFHYLIVILTSDNSWPVQYLPKIMIMFFIVSWNFIIYKKVIYR